MKTILITGASSGIGRETTKYFSNHGWRVIATMRNLQKAGDLSSIPNVVLMPLDLMNPEQIKETCQKALEQYDIDVLFNNAGYGIMGPFEKLPEKEIRKLFDTDVIGTMLVTQQFIPHFKKRKSGAILTTTSLAGIIALPRDGAYGAAKRAQKAAANQRNYLLDGNAEFPGPEEAAEVVWTAVNDGKDQIVYPTDSVCRKLYDEYKDTNIEDFKITLYDKLFC